MSHIIKVILILSLAGCSISNDAIERAQEVCLPHGGLQVLSIDGQRMTVTCKNSVTFNMRK